MKYKIIYVLMVLQLAERSFTLMYNQKIKVNNGGTVMPIQLGGYSYPMTWRNTQTSISSYSYALEGINVQSTGGVVMFDGGLTVTSTGGTFTFTTLGGSKIISATFTIFLLNNPPIGAYIEIIYSCKSPVTMSSSSHGNFEAFTESLSQNIIGTLSDYVKVALISSLYLTSSGIATQFGVAGGNYLTLNSNIYTFNFYSGSGLINVFSKICFTTITIQISSFNYNLSYTQPSYSSFVPNMNVSSNFSPYLSQKCTISFNYIWSNNPNTYTVDLLDTGNASMTNISSLIDTNINALRFEVLCLQICPPNSYVVYSQSTQACISCSNKSQYCQQCTPPTFFCTKCFLGYFFFPSQGHCYDVCPPGYYGYLPTNSCVSCTIMCRTCTNESVCTSCRSGSLVNNTCINITGCNDTIIDANGKSVCNSCNTNLFFEFQNSKCVCMAGHNSASGMCVDMIGCITAIVEFNVTICLFCNIVDNFILYGVKCMCASGFFLYQNNCTQICGDGRLFNLACDDGNTISSDGCSSTCQVENYYSCTNGSAESSSLCKYMRNYINITLTKITRSNVVINQAVFYYIIYPPLFSLQKFNLKNYITLDSVVKLQVDSVKYKSGLLSVYVNYFQDIEGFTANLTLYLNSNYFLKPFLSTNFTIKSGKSIPSFVKSQDLIRTLEKVFYIVVLIVAVTFLLSIFAHKMIGVELLVSFQIITLVHSVHTKYTSYYGLFHILSLLNANPILLEEYDNNINTKQQIITFSQTYQQFSLEVIAVTGLSLLSAFGVLCMIRVYRGLIQKKEQNGSTKLLPKLVKIAYANFLFPFTIGTLLPFFSIISIQSPTQQLIVYLLPFQLILVSLICHCEWKALFIGSQNQGFIMVKKSQPKYIAYFLVFVLLASIVLCFGFQLTNFPIELGLMMLIGFYSIWTIVYKPYHTFRDNFSIFINCSMTLLFIGWTFSRDRFSALLTQQNQILAIYVFMIFVSLAITISIFRAIAEISGKLRSTTISKNIQIDPKVKALKTSQSNNIYSRFNAEGKTVQDFQHMPNLYTNIKEQEYLKQRRRLRQDFRAKRIGVQRKAINDALL